MNELLIGPAGIPYGCKKKNSSDGIRYCKELGLGAMELEFVRGVKMGLETAAEVKKTREEENIVLTAHAPYYVNLNAVEKEKRGASRTRILQTAKVANACGAYSITFHPGYYLDMEKEQVYKTIKKQVEKIMEKVKQEDYKVWIRPETTGKGTQFGNLKELIKLSQEVEQVLPCIDFSHLCARSNGKWNSYEKFREALVLLEKGLGKKALKDMHCHVSGIEWGEKGEKNHLMFKDSKFKYKEVMKAMKEFNCKGVVICECPVQDSDALLLQKVYQKA